MNLYCTDSPVVAQEWGRVINPVGVFCWSILEAKNMLGHHQKSVGIGGKKKHLGEFWEIDFDLLKVIILLCTMVHHQKNHQFREYILLLLVVPKNIIVSKSKLKFYFGPPSFNKHQFFGWGVDSVDVLRI